MATNVDRIRTLVREIIAEAHWVSKEITQLEIEGQDGGQADTVREICQSIIITAMYDLRTEMDSLSDRLAGLHEGDPAVPAQLILGWLYRDIAPLVELATPPEDEDASLLPMQLWTGAGEITIRFNAIQAELGQLVKPS